MILSLKNITKKFGDRVILDRLSLEIPDSGIVALRGDSGAGKTTLLRIICRLDKNFDGEIQGSKDLCFAFVFQEYRLFDNLTALENIVEVIRKKPDASDRKRALDMLLRLGFTESQTAQYPRELSGGMKQRVSVARALLSDADVLLFDEPTKELDEALVSTVLELIAKDSETRPSVLVTHREKDLESLAEHIKLTVTL